MLDVAIEVASLEVELSCHSGCVMTMAMDNTLDHSTRERVQHLYSKNVELENKRRKAAQARIPSDPNTWQQMRENYEAIVLEDHAFSEQHEIEYALWQLHYRRIEELRSHLSTALTSMGTAASQNGRGATRSGPDRITKIRSQFKTFLSEATGFYHDLMIKIRAKYGLPLGYVSDEPDSQVVSTKDGSSSADVKKGLVSCHRCLIYLGDLARYKGLYGEGDSKARDFAAASSYYMQASSLWPSSGNPHHQLAILASYSGDELVAIYRYFRSLAVENPFSTARDNLIIAFEKNRQSYSQLLGDAKSPQVKTVSGRMTGKGRGKSEKIPFKDSRADANIVKEKASTIPEIFKAFSTRFVRLNGILFTRTSLETFGEVFSVVRSDFLELLSSGLEEQNYFGSTATDCKLAIIRLIAILIFTVHNGNRETENQSYAEILQRSVLLQNAFTAIFEFMGLILERCLQLSDPSGSYFLPGLMVFVEWLACRQDIAVGTDMEEKQSGARSFFWTNCVSFLNKLLSDRCMFVGEDEDETCFFSMSKYDEGETANRLALSEDFELRGFLPLLPAQLILDFSRKHAPGSDGGNKEKKARIQRIIAAGKALANVVRVGQQELCFDPKLKRFMLGVEPQISDDYMLTNSLEMSINDKGQENQVEKRTSPAKLQLQSHFYVEGEEEEEVIVFKPFTGEKHFDGVSPNTSNHGVIVSSVDTSKVGSGSDVGSGVVLHDNLHLLNSLDTSSRALASVANITSQHLQPVQPNTSKWLVDNQGAIANGLSNLNLLENGLSVMPGLQDHSVSIQPNSFLVPFPQSVGLSAGNNYPIQVQETLLSSKFDSIMPSEASLDGMSMKQSVGFKKNPVSRPVRHSGPPPGFGPVPPKPVDESVSSKSENPLMDDYSWLDGYQLPSATQTIGLSNSVSQSVQTSKNNSSMGMVSFPFPGKHVSTLQAQMESQRSWQDYQLPDHLKLYQQQAQQLQKGNQNSVVLPQQYQGQSLWDGSFFV